MGGGIGKISIPSYRSTFSIWYVCLPEYEDRDEYIKNCFSTGIVSIVNDTGEFKRAKVGKLSLQLIDFPADSDGYGSEVACLSGTYGDILYVVDVFNVSSGGTPQKENQYRFIKQNGIGVASVLVDGSGNINISVDGESANGLLNINVTNADRSGKFNLNVNGEISVVNDGKTKIRTSGEIQIEHGDGDNVTSVNIQKDLVTVVTEKLVVNSDSEPMVLGAKLETLINKILDQLAKESAGPYPLLGNSIYEQIKQDVEGIKSEKSFLD